MNMMTSLENIPLKTSSSSNSINDDSNDPLVKDILQEFHQEINNQSPTIPSSSNPQHHQHSQHSQHPQHPQHSQNMNNDYIINNQNPSNFKQNQLKTSSPFYNEDLLRKSAIIIIIVAFIFSPIIFTSILDKIPQSFSTIIQSYEFYIKLIILFLIIYILFLKNLL